jgi:hypothetical protein
VQATPRGGASEGPRDPALRSESEQALLRRYASTGSPELRDELARRFMPLARSLAMRYRRQTESLDDLVQVAALGLSRPSTASTPPVASRSPPTQCRRSSASFAVIFAITSGTYGCRAACRR